MKRLVVARSAALLLGTLAITVVGAQTPDGVTPVNEGVCDELKDGTPGLYGLCVAFCEAQDIASIEQPITEEDLATLEGSAPSGKILANYDKKKQPGDPEMPCIKVEEPCPCWSAEELAELDGIMWDGRPSYSTSPATPDGKACWDVSSLINPNYMYENIFSYEIDYLTQYAYTAAEATNYISYGTYRCVFTRYRNGPNGTSSQTYIDTNSGLTEEQYLACRDSLRDFQANSGFCQVINN